MPHRLMKMLSWFVAMLLPSMSFAQVSDPIVPHPALQTVTVGVRTMPSNHQLGKFGESLVRENLRASGFEVIDANLNDRGIDLLAVKRDAQGALKEVRPVEVKTRSQGTDFRQGTTPDGLQLSSEGIDRRLAKLAREHPEPAVRRLATEIATFKAAHPERVSPQVHGLSIGDDGVGVSKVGGKSGTTESLDGSHGFHELLSTRRPR